MNSLAHLGFLLSAVFLAVNAKTACLMNQETIMKDAEQCMAHNFRLALTISEHMGNPASMESPDFLCRYSSEIADLIQCLEVKLADCIPAQSKLLLKLLPSKQRMQDTFNFICAHRDQMKNDCMKDHMQSFMQCYMSEVQWLSSTALAKSSDPQKILCSVVRSEEKCIEKNKGSCSQEFISFVYQVLEKVFPLKQCPKALDSLLLRGEPLIFKPMNKNGRGYAIQP